MYTRNMLLYCANLHLESEYHIEFTAGFTAEQGQKTGIVGVSHQEQSLFFDANHEKLIMLVIELFDTSEPQYKKWKILKRIKV